MTEWAASLIPVGSLALGSVLTMVGQARSDRRISRRESEARRDEFRIRRYEIERDTLLALQDAVIKHVEQASQILFLIANGNQDVSLTDFALEEMRIRMLASRCLDRDAAEAVNNFCDQVNLHVRSERSATAGRGPGWGAQLTRASDLLGEALRRDSFE
jgi:hypothetical protein